MLIKNANDDIIVTFISVLPCELFIRITITHKSVMYNIVQLHIIV